MSLPIDGANGGSLQSQQKSRKKKIPKANPLVLVKQDTYL